MPENPLLKEVEIEGIKVHQLDQKEFKIMMEDEVEKIQFRNEEDRDKKPTDLDEFQDFEVHKADRKVLQLDKPIKDPV